MVNIVGKKSYRSVIGRLIFFFIFSIFTLLVWGTVTFVIFLSLTAISTVFSFKKTNKNSISVNDKGIYGNASSVPFQLTYSQITTVEVCDIDNISHLIITSGPTRYVIRIKNSIDVSNAILSNISFVASNTQNETIFEESSSPNKSRLPSQTEPVDISKSYTICDGNEMEKEIIQLYIKEGPIENFYLFGHMPLKKLENAKKAYAPNITEDEKIIFLYDNTVLGSAKRGFLLTSKCLYFRGVFNKCGSVMISGIYEIINNCFENTSENAPTIIIRSLSGTFELNVSATVITQRNEGKWDTDSLFNVLAKTIELLKQY